jgi:hypothetical protein
MTISELIKALEDLADKHGDVYVEMSNGHLVASVEPMRQEDSDEVIADRIK